MNSTIDKKHLYQLLDEFDVAMLVTHSNTKIHARPMVVARLEQEMCTYLVTELNSVKVDEISANPQALLSFQSTRQFASLSGELELVKDRTLVELMWKEIWKVWFPKGKSDPNFAVLKFVPSEGEFWDNVGMLGLKYVYNAAKAYVAGQTPEVNKDQHAKVAL